MLKMKKLLFSLFTAMLLFCGCNQSKQFKVTLNLDNAENKNVYLVKEVDGQQIVLDTAVFEGKTAVLTADPDDPQTCYIIKFDKDADCGVFPFFTENQNTTITGDLEAMEKWTVKGCPSMDAFNAYRQEMQPKEDAMLALNDALMEAYMAGDTAKCESLVNEITASMEAYKNDRLDYIKNHPDSYLAHFMLDQDKEEFEMDEVKEAASHFTTESIYSKRVKEYIEKWSHFIDFTLKTAEGTDVKLGEVIQNNTVTLVDFWASWCGPCRHENPNVKAAYEKYHEKGLEIVGVSVDTDEAAWLKAVAEDGLPWIHVRDVDQSVGATYHVQYIPTNFLYDQNGTLLAKNLREEQLEARLAEVLK